MNRRVKEAARAGGLGAGLLAMCGYAAAAESFRGELWGGYASGSAGISGYRIPDDYVPPEGPGEPGEPLLPGETPGSSEDYDGWRVAGRVYLDGVDGSRGPYRLAPFLDRASHVGAAFQSLESDSGVEADVWRVDTRLVYEAWVAEAAYGQADAGFGALDTDADQRRMAVGRKAPPGRRSDASARRSPMPAAGHSRHPCRHRRRPRRAADTNPADGRHR